ncbi:lipopolysaccharide biosynthesis protein [Paenibacillus sp. CMAA1364]
MNVVNKRMFSNGLIYLFSSIFTQLMNLILIPLYTRNLSQEDYGHYDLIISVQQLLAIAITLGVYSGMIRFFHDYENKNDLKNAAMSFSIIWGGCCTGLAWLANPWLYPLLFGDDNHGNLFIPLIVMSSVLVCFNKTYSSYHAMKFNALKSSSIQLSTILSTLLFVYIFFITFNMGIVGILLAQLCGNLVIFLFVFVVDLRHFKWRLDVGQLKNMLRYGSGLMLGDVSSWVLTLSDRFLIKGYMNLSSVAVYSVGYKIGMLINPLFINPFSSMFTPFKFSVYKEENGREQIGSMFRLYNFIGWFGVLGLSLFANVAIDLIAPKEYATASNLVPIIALSYFLSGAISFYSLGLHIANKMRTNSMITILAALINIVANMLLIPWLGIYGSALSTVIAYMIANGVFYHYGSKYYQLGFGLLYPYKFLSIIVPIYGVYYYLTHIFNYIFIDYFVMELLLNTVLCAFFVWFSMKCKFISKEEVVGVLQNFRKRKLPDSVVNEASSNT